MKLNICHLYPELLNLYGDIGNVTILKYRAESRGIPVDIHNHTIGDDFDKDLYDIVLFGGGQDFEMGIVSEDIKNGKCSLLKDYIEESKVFLAICGGYQMLGDYYTLPTGEKIDGLGILPFYTVGGDKRLIGNIATEIDGEVCVGFENHAGRTYIGELSPLGKVVHGFGNNGEDKGEGVRYNNTFCTYLHGPFLSKNPKIADLILKTALEKRFGEVSLAPLDDTYEIKARDSVLKKWAIAK